ncbi:MAG: hypothetical protein RLZZ232_1665 [Planctomycetota bacterium]|jgi:uncharacterized membrane protein YeiH
MIPLIEIMAVVSGAVFGVLTARRKGFDFVGVASVAFMTAFGGGTLRDLLLDRHPLFWIENSRYPVMVFVVAAIAAVIPGISASFERFLHLPDALGLGLFSIVGTELALEQNVGSFVAVLLGVITGSFGGVIADIVCNDVPGLFRPATPLYATCAFVGGWLLILLKLTSLDPSISFFVAASVVVVFRLLALRFNIVLSKVPPP